MASGHSGPEHSMSTWRRSSSASGHRTRLATRPPSTRKMMCPRKNTRRDGLTLRRTQRAASASVWRKRASAARPSVNRGQPPKWGRRRSFPPAGVRRSQVELPGVVHRLVAQPAGTERCECAGTPHARPRRWFASPARFAQLVEHPRRYPRRGTRVDRSPAVPRAYQSANARS